MSSVTVVSSVNVASVMPIVISMTLKNVMTREFNDRSDD